MLYSLPCICVTDPTPLSYPIPSESLHSLPGFRPFLPRIAGLPSMYRHLFGLLCYWQCCNSSDSQSLADPHIHTSTRMFTASICLCCHSCSLFGFSHASFSDTCCLNQSIWSASVQLPTTCFTKHNSILLHCPFGGWRKGFFSMVRNVNANCGTLPEEFRLIPFAHYGQYLEGLKSFELGSYVARACSQCTRVQWKFLWDMSYAKTAIFYNKI